jgi:hypothetical protein
MFLNFLNRLHISKPWRYGYERSYTKYELKYLLNHLGFKKPKVFGVGVFEGLYITAYFSLNKPEILLRMLDGFLFDKTDSVRAMILKRFSEFVEKIGVLGLYVVAYDHSRIGKRYASCDKSNLKL